MFKWVCYQGLGNAPKAVPDCERLAGSPGRETGGSWWVRRWWLAGTAGIMTSCCAGSTKRIAAIATCPRTNRRNRPGTRGIRPRGERPAGRRGSICGAERGGTSRGWPRPCWQMTGRKRWHRHFRTRPVHVPNGNFAAGNLGRKPANFTKIDREMTNVYFKRLNGTITFDSFYFKIIFFLFDCRPPV